jgi:para-aminobenzoate synthetase component 1
MGRYDIVCAQPAASLVTRGGGTEICGPDGMRHSEEDPFSLLREQLGPPCEPLPGIPFCGGALGYWGYDLARRLMHLPQQARDGEGLPEMAAGIYDWAVVLDHRLKTAQLVSRQRLPQTAAALPDILGRLQSAIPAPPGGFRVFGPVASNFTRSGYEAAFARIQDYLHAGDCYQVNLAQRYAAHASGDALPAYLELRRLSPAPCSAFLSLPQAQILCASPERFLRVRAGEVETRPIKGTRPRRADAALDARLACELQNSPKERAENLMIVDLLRNDLGRSCEPGSVQVRKLFEVESFAQVHHLVSTVAGRLAPGQDALSLLRNCFPGGSVTGAPKLRAMQIIEQLEPHRRGVYCGAIGYIGHDGNMDSNIAIRTLVYSGGEIRFWTGGGIVADSSAASEYQETLAKAAGLLELLKRYGGELA